LLVPNVNGITNLKTLLATMQPVLTELPYVFCPVSQAVYDQLPFEPLGTFHEQEAITVITTKKQAKDYGLPFHATWACITLTVHSSLAAVGLLAAITGRLAQAGISVNPISAYYHDHLFVPWESRESVMDILRELVCNNPRRGKARKESSS
jgi:hypothetical protein